MKEALALIIPVLLLAPVQGETPGQLQHEAAMEALRQFERDVSPDGLTEDERASLARGEADLAEMRALTVAARTMPTPAPCRDHDGLALFHDGENEGLTTFYLGAGADRIVVTLCWHTDDKDANKWPVHITSAIAAPQLP